MFSTYFGGDGVGEIMNASPAGARLYGLRFEDDFLFGESLRETIFLEL